MSVVWPVVGAALILAVAREVFHTLFHPSGQSAPTTLVFRGVWAASGWLGGRARRQAGPVSMVVLIALWVGLTVLGWALIYMPSLPDGFIFASPLTRENQTGVVDALYYSWVTQSTLGFGDITPTRGLLRILAPLQATLGFALFTMVVTWVLSVYPALQRQRSAASLAHAVRLAHERDGTPVHTNPVVLARQMERLADKVNSARADFVQYPSTFYFAAPADTLSLASALPFTVRLAHAGARHEETRAAAALLSASVELLCKALAEQHLDMADAAVNDVLRAYLRHQGVEPCGALT